ncbi:hypothetical protein LCGC14_2129800, partial [marine sediment metagenome]
MCEQCGLLTDELAEGVAVEIVETRIRKAFNVYLHEEILSGILEPIEKANKPEFFVFRDSIVIRFRKKFENMMKRHWE